jgi:hypothetical protein
MVRRKHHLLLVLAVIHSLNFVADPLGASQPNIGTETKTISLGSISERPRERIKDYRDFVNYLAQRLSSTAEIKGGVVVALTATQLASFLNEKKVDFYMESPYPTFLINEQTCRRAHRRILGSSVKAAQRIKNPRLVCFRMHAGCIGQPEMCRIDRQSFASK